MHVASEQTLASEQRVCETNCKREIRRHKTYICACVYICKTTCIFSHGSKICQCVKHNKETLKFPSKKMPCKPPPKAWDEKKLAGSERKLAFWCCLSQVLPNILPFFYKKVSNSYLITAMVVDKSQLYDSASSAILTFV